MLCLSRKRLISALLGAALAAGAAGSASAATEIEWWHAMTGARNQVVLELVDQFNKSQSDYRLVPVFKGKTQFQCVSLGAECLSG